MSRSRRYWRRRFTQIAIEQQNRSDLAIRESNRLNHRARRNIQRLVDEFVGKYAKNGVIAESSARELLSKTEQHSWRMTLSEFRQKAVDGGFHQELNAEYYRSRISRLQQLQVQIDMETVKLANSNNSLLSEHLADSANQTYWRSVTEIGKGSSLNTNFARFNPEMVRQLINQPNAGMHFSRRVWGNNRTKLAKELKNILSDGVVRGDSIQKMTRQLMERMDVARNRAVTLIRTESAHVAEQATLKSYVDTGVEKYEYLATLCDTRTCKECKKLHEKIFERIRAVIGVNYPLMHPNCRCTTAPVIEV